jgi:SNF2 family DNA or RNA helicase
MQRGQLAKIKDDTQFYPHQIEGVRKMARISSFLLADEMGLGKSLQALTVAAIDYELGHAKRTLIVAPVSLKWNWMDEIEKFTHYTALVLDGTPRERVVQLEQFENLDYDILIVNYEQVGRHLAELNALRFDIIVWDEAHYLKNPTSKRTKASLRLHSARSFLLTGSPLLNQVNELYTILHRIAPLNFPTYSQFTNRYCVYGGWKNKQIVGVKNKAELMTRIENVMIRRLKKDVLDLPEKQYITIKVDLTTEQLKLYKQVEEDLLLSLPDQPEPMEIENALTKFLRLKQICGTTLPFSGEDHSSKLDRAVEMATEIVDNGEPTVIFTQFRAVIQALEDRFAALADPITTFSLHGDVPKQERSNVVKAWGEHRSSDGRPSVLIAGLQVSGVGLNMTQANKCIFVDKLFVPKLNEQAEDRLHRIGADATKPIQIYEIIARGTIEQRIEAILRTKRKLFDGLIENNAWKKELYNAFREETSNAP